MNKNELVRAAAERTGFTLKDTEATLDAILESIQCTVSVNEKVQLVGFGSFEPRERQARTLISPVTKEEIDVPATRVPVFKAGKTFKNAVAAPFKEAAANIAKKPKKK